MPDPQTTSALKADKQHQEQPELDSIAFTAAGDEKIASVNVDATSNPISSTSSSDDGFEQDVAEKATGDKRKWYKRLNPLRLRKIPSVPEERTVSPEYGASILSVTLFLWMSPLMNVSNSQTALFESILINPKLL